MGLENYGLPYMGSKSKIADWVVSHLPSSNVFVDLFAGGCAITHCAMKHNRWSKYIANDITDAPRLFLDAVNGKYKNEDRWIGREDFFRLKDTDPYVRICWSFGNDQSAYMYSPEVERFKKHLHKVFKACKAWKDWKYPKMIIGRLKYHMAPPFIAILPIKIRVVI
jgi:adenine-specific DNA methylase